MRLPTIAPDQNPLPGTAEPRVPDALRAIEPSCPVRAERPAGADTVLVICRPFRPDPALLPGVSFLFVDPDGAGWDEIESVRKNFSRVFVEESVLAALPAPPPLAFTPIRDFVAAGEGAVRLLCFVSSDTNVRLLAPVMLAFETLAVVPSRAVKDEGAIEVLREMGLPYVEISRAEARNPAIAAFNPTVALTAADWTSEFLHGRTQLQEMGVPTIGLQEGPHDLASSFEQEINGVVFSKVSNQYRTVDVFLAQGSRHLDFMRTKYFAVTGNPKIQRFEPVTEGLAPRVFINLNFTYAQTKPAYEAERALWLKEVLAAVREARIPYIISQHPRDTAAIDDPNVLPSHAGIVAEQIRLCTLSISRLSSIIYEAARDGLRSVYFNPHHEPIGLFNLGADADLDVCMSRRQLIEVLREHAADPQARRGDPERFLRAHCGPQDGGAVERIMRAIGAVASNRARIASLAASLEEHGQEAPAAAPLTPGQRLRVAVFGRFPAKGYSGGRIHGWTLAEAAAHAGHDVTVVTPCIPEFSENFAYLPRHQSIRVAMSPDLRRWQPPGRFDVVFMIPGMDRDDTAYRAAIGFAEERGAALVLVNFESPNWFNRYAPTPRDETLWDHWRLISRHARVVLSSAEEGTRFARAFYTDAAPGCAFETLPCAINAGLIEGAPEPAVRARRVLAFTRSGLADHKGAADLPSLVVPEMAGHVLTVVSGNALEPERVAALEAAAAAAGATLELLVAITDERKAALLKDSALLLFPSLFEGLGLPPMEAVYAGTPCVAFDLPVLREICGDWLTYARHGDFDDFRARIAEALRNPRDVAGGRSSIAPFAHIDGMAAGLDGIMRAALAAPAAPAAGTPLADLFRGARHLPPVAEPHVAEPYEVLRGSPGLPAPARPTQRRVALFSLVPPVPADQGNRLVTHHLVSHLLAQGHDVDLILQGDCPAGLLAEAYGDRVRVLSVPMPDWRNTPEAKWRQEVSERALAGEPNAPHRAVREAVDREASKFHPFYIMSPEWVELALRALRTGNYGAVYCNYLHTLLPVALLREMGAALPGPVAVVTHDAMSRLSRSVDGVPLDTTFRYCAPEREAEALNAADVVVAITPGEAAYFRSIGVERRIVVSSYSGAEDFAARAASEAAFHRRTIVYTASNNPLNRRGLDGFLQSCWPRILERHPDARLRVAGTVCNGLASFPGLERMGTVTREEIVDLLSQGTIVINPGRSGTGLKIKTVEAICAAVPFVTFPDGLEGVEEFEDAGYVATDWDDFTLGCLRMLEEPAFWLQRHRFARAHAAAAFSRAAVFGALDGAVAELRGAVPPAPETGDAPPAPPERALAAGLHEAATQALLRGRIASGRKMLGEALALDPGNEAAYDVAWSLAQEMVDGPAMRRLAAQRIAYDPFAERGHLDFAEALALDDPRRAERALAHAILACPGSTRLLAAYVDLVVGLGEPQRAAWILRSRGGDEALLEALGPESLERIGQMDAARVRETADTAPLVRTFETVFTTRNVSDSNWRFGIWKNPARPGFTVQRPQTNITFAPGNLLRFRGSGLRRVVRVDGKAPNQNVWLDRPIDPEADGHPNLVFLLPAVGWALSEDASGRHLALSGVVEPDFCGLAVSGEGGGEPRVALSTYWRRDIEKKLGLAKNTVRGITLAVNWDQPAGEASSLLVSRGKAEEAATLRLRRAPLAPEAMCVAEEALPAEQSADFQLSTVEVSDRHLLIKAYIRDEGLPLRLQLLDGGTVLADLQAEPAGGAGPGGALPALVLRLTADRLACERRARNVRVLATTADAVHWQRRGLGALVPRAQPAPAAAELA